MKGGKMAIVAVLAASFSLREKETNPCNVRIAKEAVRICQELERAGHTPLLAAQWEVGLALQKLGRFAEFEDDQALFAAKAWPYHEVELLEDGGYLDTQQVLSEAMPFFCHFEATHFVGVANPFIHQPYLYWLARRATGMELMWRKVKWIGFDKQSTQWWCRSWWQFLFQTVRLALGIKHGYNGRQERTS